MLTLIWGLTVFSLKNFLEKDGDGVFYIGHASALARINKKLILFDPVWNYKPYGDYWEFRPEQINLDDILDRIDICVVSHIHADHVCERILSRLNCTIFILGGRDVLKKRLSDFGCKVREFEPFKWDRGFYFVPHAFNSIDSSCFVQGQKYCIYHGNDNFLSQELIERIRPQIPKVHVAMVPYAFIHWYPFCMNMPMDEKLKEIERLNRQSLDQAEMFCKAFRPKRVIAFGANLFHVENEFLNQHLSKPIDFRQATSMVAGDFIVGDEIFFGKPHKYRDLSTLVERVVKAKTTVPDHQIIVNTTMIDLEDLTVTELGKPTKSYTQFDFKPVEYLKWLSGEITFEQAIGTRQFTCTRVPNVYNLQVFEWMNRWL